MRDAPVELNGLFIASESIKARLFGIAEAGVSALSRLVDGSPTQKIDNRLMFHAIHFFVRSFQSPSLSEVAWLATLTGIQRPSDFSLPSSNLMMRSATL